MDKDDLTAIQGRRMAAAQLPGDSGMWIVSQRVLDDLDRLIAEVRQLQAQPRSVPYTECMALRTTGPEGRFICDRPDPHPSVFGSDDEGHYWVQVTAEQWDAAMAALSTDI